MSQSSEIILLNFQIKLQRDKNGKTYFLIRNQETSMAYLAFYGQVKRGWSDLETKFPKAKVILIKSTEEGNKITSLRVLTERELRES